MQDVTGGLAADGQSRALLPSFIIIGAVQHHWVVLLDELRCPQAHLQVNLASTNKEEVGLKLSNPAMQQQDVTCYMTTQNVGRHGAAERTANHFTAVTPEQSTDDKPLV
jgi:hypothetical protein